MEALIGSFKLAGGLIFFGFYLGLGVAFGVGLAKWCIKKTGGGSQ